MSQLQHKLSQRADKDLIVEEMIEEDSVNIIVGDSGIGKSPLLMQLAICVATGTPFLGLRTKLGPVLCADYENSEKGFYKTVECLCEYLKIPEIPDNLLFYHFPESIEQLKLEIAKHKPALVIVDALRGLDPAMEKDATAAATQLRNLHKVAEYYHCAFLLLHHIKKIDRKEEPPKITACPIMEWLEQASGSRALVNQTDARFGVEASDGDTAMIMRGHFKLEGEVGPYHIRRDYDDQGQAIGYGRITGLALLSQIERDRYTKLPGTFTWKEAENLLFPGKKGGKALSQLIHRALSASILSKIRKSKKDVSYSKI